jgi:hypothetical protein
MVAIASIRVGATRTAQGRPGRKPSASASPKSSRRGREERSVWAFPPSRVWTDLWGTLGVTIGDDVFPPTRMRSKE